MNEKRRPHYDLSVIKSAFADPARLNRTFSSKQGAAALGMNDSDVVTILQSLGSKDFDKSMTSYADPKTWQDVYRPMSKGRALYVKFTLDDQKAPLLISFKEA